MFAHMLQAHSNSPRRAKALAALSTVSLALTWGALAAPRAGAFGAAASANPLSGSAFEGADAGLGPGAGVAQSPSASPAGRTDWSSYVGAGALPGLHTMDDPPAADSMFTGGDKELEPGAWGLTTKADGVTPGKDDVRVAWGIPDARAAGTFFYLALKREAANGDTFLTFELNKASVSWNNGTATIPCRQTGDLLISYELTPSGTPVDVVPYRWTSTDTQTVTVGGNTYHCAKTGTVAASASPSPSEVQAAMNWSSGSFTGSITNVLAPGTYGATFAEGLFAETALNLDLILFDVADDPCANFGQWQIHTRSAVGGQSDVAHSQLQDLVGPQPLVVRSCGVTGFKFHDLNGDGTWQKAGAGAEPGLGGWTIYVDLNDDGQRQSSEPSAETAADGSYTIGGVPSGDHMVREEAPAGAGSGWKCTAPAPDSSLPGPSALRCGHEVHFTTGTASTDKDGHAVDFGNFETPKLTVTKHVVNDDGGSAAAADFQMDVAGGHVSDAHFAGTEAGHTVTLDAGSYSVDESGGPSGYEKSRSAGCSGTLAPGASATCTITNNDIAPRITVVKHVIGGGDASSFTMLVDAGHPSDASFAGAESPGHPVTVDAGHYSVDEGGHAHYTETRSEGCDGTVALGAERTCTITNVKKATVQIQKLTAPADTGEQKQEFGFHTNLTGADTFQLTHGQTETREVEPGTYGVVEDDPRSAGYKLVGLQCAEDGAQDTAVVGSISAQRSVSIHAQAGETIRCVFTNALVVAGVEVVKSGPAWAYHGDTLDFTFAVHSLAASPLHDIRVTDDHCADVSADPVAKHNDDGDGLLEVIGLDGTHPEEWVFTCSMPVPAHQADEENPLVNTAGVAGLDEYDRSVHDTDSHSTKILHPAIDIEKAGPATATAGSVVTYALTVTNPGDEAFAEGLVVVTDALCEAPPFLVAKSDGNGADDSPGTFDPGDTWLYGCRVQTLPTQTSVHNVADVTGTDEHGKVVRDSDPADTVLSAIQVEAAAAANPGTAKLRGPAGCVTSRKSARVTGSQIARVVFKLDGRRLASLSKANGKGNAFQVHVSPGGLRVGVHKLSARVTFKAASKTKAKTLRLAFFRCAKKVLPRFTG